jgi:uncharacterized repeat protein (TIGR01451 family)
MTTLTRMRRVPLLLLLALSLAVLLVVPATGSAATMISLGSARGFGALAGSTVTNTGSSVVTGTAGGDVGVSAGSSITGFPPGILSGVQRSNDAVAIQAQIDLGNAYTDAATQITTSDLTGQDLGGLTLTPGVYAFSTSAQLTGNLTLNAQGDPNAVFIFKIGSTLTAASSSSVTLINSAQPCHIFWQVGSSATLGSGTQFAGHIMAQASISTQAGTTVLGQLLARTGAVTLIDTDITNNFCVAAAAPAAVAVTKSLAPGQSAAVQVGAPVSYAIVVTNSGETTLATVPLTDTFDSAHLAYVSASPTPDSTSTGSLTWTDLTGAGLLRTVRVRDCDVHRHHTRHVSAEHCDRRGSHRRQRCSRADRD